MLTVLPLVKCPPKSRAVRYYLAGILNLPFSCPSLVYLADMYGIYKSNVPLLIKKTSFEVKHCKIGTVLILRSAQAAKLKKTYLKHQDLRDLITIVRKGTGVLN